MPGPITRKILFSGMLGAGSVTFNQPGSFVVPPRLYKAKLEGKGNPGNPGTAGSAGEAGGKGGSNEGNPEKVEEVAAEGAPTMKKSLTQVILVKKGKVVEVIRAMAVEAEVRKLSRKNIQIQDHIGQDQVKRVKVDKMEIKAMEMLELLEILETQVKMVNQVKL